ncbi:flagellar basal body P-ring formation chaperone FlgA [Azospirillum canadense]|uniref:flagellar basal body P-ring formation chaperone FlgA n=1 Tax=Azospirillum canadense TaxID=403962 RepID=UPI0022268293|nr:flagellar basal body P-ring formation chaperone FlgA [Azospirillum canadense]MCW2239938.1 flagella basal body P-ring formation protein FlgA [Azospirillum canadense]
MARGTRKLAFALALHLLCGGAAEAAFLSTAEGPVESLLAHELAASLGNAVPAEARVSLVLTAPFAGPVEAVRDLSYDPRSGNVRALVSSEGRIVEVRAKADILVEVPVPTRRILPGEIIADGDLTFIQMPMDRLNDTVVSSRDALVGMASRRQLSAGRLIQASAVGTPVVVQRNKPVSLLYEDGPLQLMARGRALQDGGVGDSVRVMNIASNIVVTGTITGPQTVSVAGPPAIAARP